MIRVTVEIREKAATHRVRITAPTVARALELTGDGRPGKSARVVSPIAPAAFFAGGAFAGREPIFPQPVAA